MIDPRRELPTRRQHAALAAELAELAALVLDERAPPSDGKVTIGSIVEIEDEWGERMEVEVSCAGEAGAVSPDSPLGSALLGAAEGESVEVAAPRGSWRARILSVRR